LSKWLSNKDVVAGGILILFSTWFYFTSRAIPDGSVTGMPPGFFPTFLAVCLGVCSVYLFLKGVKDVLRNKAAAVEMRQDHKTVLILLGMLFVYVILLNIVGFIPITIIYLTSVMALLKAGKLLKLVSISVVMTLAVYFAFGNLFNIPLP
jgi:putative tricarboxylic transport membrane protein